MVSAIIADLVFFNKHLSQDEFDTYLQMCVAKQHISIDEIRLHILAYNHYISTQQPDRDVCKCWSQFIMLAIENFKSEKNEPIDNLPTLHQYIPRSPKQKIVTSINNNLQGYGLFNPNIFIEKVICAKTANEIGIIVGQYEMNKRINFRQHSRRQLFLTIQRIRMKKFDISNAEKGYREIIKKNTTSIP